MLRGIPYKLYALQSPSANIGLGGFLLASAGARLSRFLAVTAIVWLVGATVLRHLSLPAKLRVHTAAWLAFYAFYFWRMGF